MKNLLHRYKTEEHGAAEVIEMTLIFPLVLFVIGFLIYMSMYILQGATLYNDAQRIAVVASREAAIPGYEYLYEGKGVTTKADFESSSMFTKTAVTRLMKEHDPYRYWGTGFLSATEKNTLEGNLKRLVNNSSLIANSNVSCEITTNNNILSQQINVHVVKYISAPGILRFFGITEGLDMDVTVVAVVGDPAEFIRNTDMVFDLTEYMYKNLKIGGKTPNEIIASYKEKFSAVGKTLGLEW